MKTITLLIAKYALRLLPNDTTPDDLDKVIPNLSAIVSAAYLKSLVELTPQALAAIVQANTRLDEKQRMQIAGILNAGQRDTTYLQ